MNEFKNKLNKEQTEFYRRNSIVEFELQQLGINYKRATQELDDVRMQLENESLVKKNSFAIYKIKEFYLKFFFCKYKDKK
jgi:hypothetical protein